MRYTGRYCHLSLLSSLTSSRWLKSLEVGATATRWLKLIVARISDTFTLIRVVVSLRLMQRHDRGVDRVSDFQVELEFLRTWRNFGGVLSR